MSNKIRADVKLNTRRNLGYSEVAPFEDGPFQDEQRFTYDYLIARNERGEKRGGTTKLNFQVNEIRSSQSFYICSEPNWFETMITYDDLKKWLKERGMHPKFFFPQENVEGFRNAEHPRYSAKLACACAAWEGVSEALPNKSVKQSIQDWVQSNGVRFGIGEDSIVSPTAAEEIAKIANWNTKGGANRTSVAEAEASAEIQEPIENFNYGYPEYDEEDSEIPF